MLARQVPTAQGRFLVSNPMTVPSKVAHDALAKAFPEYKFPEGKDEPSKVVIDNSKVGTPRQPHSQCVCMLGRQAHSML